MLHAKQKAPGLRSAFSLQTPGQPPITARASLMRRPITFAVPSRPRRSSANSTTGPTGPKQVMEKGPRKHDWEVGGWVQRWPIRCRPSRPIGGVGGRRPLDVVVLVTWGLTGPEPPDSLRLVGVASWRGHCELPDQPIVRAHILTRLGRFRSQSPAAGVAVGPRRFEHWTAPHLAP